MANDLLYMEGCDGITTVAADSAEVLLDRPWTTTTAPDTTNGMPFVVTGGHAGGRAMRIHAARSGNHDRGLRLNVQNENADLWVGWWWRLNTSGLHVRILVLYVDGVAVWSVQNQSNNGTIYSVLNPDMSGVAELEDAAESIVTTGTQVNDECRFRVHVRREASEGTVDLYLDGDLIISDTFAAIAAGAGPIDVLFNGRSSITNSSNFSSDYDELWVAESDYGEPRIIVLRPDADGTYTDGTLSTGTDAFAILNQDLNVTTEDVTLAGGDKLTMEIDAAQLATLNALNAAAIQVDIYTEGPTSVDAIHRLGGTDYNLGTVNQPAAGTATGRLLLFTNPATGGSFVPSDFEGGEFGMEA